MSYFYNFPQTFYRFGTEKNPTVVQNLAAYVQVIDEVRDNVAFYTKYNILDGDRPDQVSKKIYGTSDYYFTFFMLNDNIREQGWPLSQREIDKKVKKDRNLFTVTTRDPLSEVLQPGQTIEGLASGATARIIRRRLDFGQLIVQLQSNQAGNTPKFNNSEIIRSDNGSGFDTATLVGAQPEWQSIHHYVDGNNEYADIDPAAAPGAQLVPITYQEEYKNVNDDLRAIKVIRPDAIISVYRAFQEAMQA